MKSKYLVLVFELNTIIQNRIDVFGQSRKLV